MHIEKLQFFIFILCLGLVFIGCVISGCIQSNNSSSKIPIMVPTSPQIQITTEITQLTPTLSQNSSKLPQNTNCTPLDSNYGCTRSIW
jgi:hypothetical protein